MRKLSKRLADTRPEQVQYLGAVLHDDRAQAWEKYVIY